MAFWKFLDARVKGQEKNIPWFVNDKLKAYDFYKKNNLPTPEILHIYDTPGQVDFDQMPDSFCIKPANMHSAAGVMPLIKLSSGLYLDRLRKRVISVEGVVKEQELVFDKCNFKSTYKIIIEEGLGHQANGFLIPYDYKLYAFANGIGVILQIDRNSDKPYISFFDGGFSPLGFDGVINVDRPSIVRRGSPVVPVHAAEMITCARRIPALLNTPFVSVDMYSTNKGFFIGEITPAPGAPYYKDIFEFSQEYDEMLGGLWSEFSASLSI
ncbi:TPA: ATP-grasp fold amidoligase family protein [Pseudomonas putida]